MNKSKNSYLLACTLAALTFVACQNEDVTNKISNDTTIVQQKNNLENQDIIEKIGLPKEFSNQLIGSSSKETKLGSFDWEKDRFVIKGQGNDIAKDAGKTDEFQFTNMKMTGDYEIIARLVDFDTANSKKSKAGIIIRGDISTNNSPYMGLFIDTNKSQLRYARRISNNKAGASAIVSTYEYPVYMRVKKVTNGGNVSIYTAVSQDPTFQQGVSEKKASIPFTSDTTYVGFAVCAGSGAKGEPTAIFDNVKIKQNNKVVYSSTPERVPNKPKNLNSIIGNEEVVLSWSKTHLAKNYSVEYTKDNKNYIVAVENTKDTRAKITGLENGKEYSFIVKSKNKFGENVSDKIKVTTDISNLLPPMGFSAKPKNNSTVLTWDKSNGADSYDIFISNNGIDFRLIKESVIDTSVIIEDLKNEHQYHFKVTAKGTNMTSKDSDIMAVTPNPVPEIAKDFLAATGESKVSFSWKRAKGVTYTFERSTSKDGVYEIINSGVTDRFFVDEELDTNKTYYYKVYPVKKGVEGESSEFVFSPKLKNNPIKKLKIKDSFTAPRWILSSNFDENIMLFSDRTYKTRVVPKKYRGLDWLRTAVDSKTYIGKTLAEFTLRNDSELYLAVDSRVFNSTLSTPKWIEEDGWVDTSDVIMDDGPSQNVKYMIFRKNFKKNSKVSLGANTPNGNTGTVTYFVLIKPNLVRTKDIPNYTNKKTFKLDAEVTPDTKVILSLNDKKIVDKTFDGSSSIMKSIKLNKGLNKIEIFAENSKGVTFSKLYEITYDNKKPIIKLKREPKNFPKSAFTILNGTVDKGSFVTVVHNKKTVFEEDLKTNAQFSKSFSLTEGLNQISITAKDKAGNITSKNYDINYKFSVEEIKFSSTPIEVNKVSSLSKTNEIFALANIKNEMKTAKEIVLTIQLYDKANNINNAISQPITIKPFENRTVSVGIPMPSGMKKGYSLKAYVWDGIDDTNKLSNVIKLQ